MSTLMDCQNKHYQDNRTVSLENLIDEHSKNEEQAFWTFFELLDKFTEEYNNSKSNNSESWLYLYVK